MGWTTELALQTLGNERKIKITLTEGMVYPKKDSWQILISGLGVFVIVEEEKTFIENPKQTFKLINENNILFYAYKG